MTKTLNRRETEVFMAEKGLSYCAWKSHEAAQIYTVAGDAGKGKSLVLARVSGIDRPDTYHWGFYYDDDAMDIARAVKRLRKVYVLSVTVIQSATRI